MNRGRYLGFNSSEYGIPDFAERPLGQQLYLGVRYCGGFPGVSNAGDLTDGQLKFLYSADVERQRVFLEAIANMFSDS